MPTSDGPATSVSGIPCVPGPRGRLAQPGGAVIALASFVSPKPIVLLQHRMDLSLQRLHEEADSCCICPLRAIVALRSAKRMARGVMRGGSDCHRVIDWAVEEGLP